MGEFSTGPASILSLLRELHRKLHGPLPPFLRSPPRILFFPLPLPLPVRIPSSVFRRGGKSAGSSCVALAITRLHRRCQGPSSACHAPACPSSTCTPAAVRLVSLRSFILSFRSSLSLFLSVSPGSLWALSLSLAETRSVRSPRPH